MSVVTRPEALEKSVGNGKVRHVLDIRVVFGRVGHNVMDVVVPLPPAYGKAAEEIGNDDTNDRVQLEVVRDAIVAGVVCNEDELVPRHPHEHRTQRIVSAVQECEHQDNKEEVASGIREI